MANLRPTYLSIIIRECRRLFVRQFRNQPTKYYVDICKPDPRDGSRRMLISYDSFIKYRPDPDLEQAGLPIKIEAYELAFWPEFVIIVGTMLHKGRITLHYADPTFFELIVEIVCRHLPTKYYHPVGSEGT